MYNQTSETYNLASKTITFAGETENGIGDQDGTGNPTTLFTVTGVVYAKVFAVVDTDVAIAAGATLEVGTAMNTAGIIAQTAGDALDAKEIWHDNSPDASVEAGTVVAEKIVTDNIIQTVGTANVNTGVVKYYCLWRPISANATVV